MGKSIEPEAPDKTKTWLRPSCYALYKVITLITDEYFPNIY